MAKKSSKAKKSVIPEEKKDVAPNPQPTPSPEKKI